MAAKELKECFAEVIDEFTLNYLSLNVNHNLSITPKVHIIINHLKEYCVSTGLSLGRCTDKIVESVHQVVNSRFTNSKYYVKYHKSDKHGKKFYEGMIHVNSYNL